MNNKLFVKYLFILNFLILLGVSPLKVNANTTDDEIIYNLTKTDTYTIKIPKNVKCDVENTIEIVGDIRGYKSIVLDIPQTVTLTDTTGSITETCTIDCTKSEFYGPNINDNTSITVNNIENKAGNYTGSFEIAVKIKDNAGYYSTDFTDYIAYGQEPKDWYDKNRELIQTNLDDKIVVYPGSNWFIDYLQSHGALTDEIYNEIKNGIGSQAYFPDSKIKAFVQLPGVSKNQYVFSNNENIIYADLSNANYFYFLEGKQEYTTLFTNCTSLKRVDAPNQLISTIIPKAMFKECINLESFEIPENTTKIYDYSFKNCNKLTIGDIPTQVESIGIEAFLGTKIKKITASNKLSYIDRRAFTGCSELVTVDLSASTNGKLLQASSMIFKECGKLEEIKLNDAVTTIPAEFAYHSILKDFHFPDNLEKIGQGAFVGTKITEIDLPASVIALDTTVSPFTRCTELMRADLSKCDKLYDLGGRINNGTFQGCTKLSEVLLPPNLTTIRESAFKNCDALKTISIPNSLNTIGNEAFRESGIESIDFSNTNITEIPENCFCICRSLIEVKVPNCLTIIHTRAFGGASDTDVYRCNINKIDLSQTQLTTIEENAFRYSSKLTDIKFPKTIESIGENAFEACGFSNLDLSDSHLSYIGKNAFLNSNLNIVDLSNTQLTELQDGEIKETYYGIFANCIKLTNVYLPETLTYIGACVFAKNTNIVELDLSNTKVTEIGNSAFYKVGNVDILLPNSLLKIADNAFYLGKVSNIPDTVTEIGSNAFLGIANVNYTGPATGCPWGAKAINGVTVTSSDTVQESPTIPDEITTITNDAAVSSGNAETNTSDEIISDDTEDTLSDDDWMQLALSVSDGNAAPGDREKCEEKLTEMQENGITPEISELMKILMQIIISMILPRFQWY